MTGRGAFLVTALVALSATFAEPGALPIYIEDNHAGSFYWLAQHLDLEESCTLLHFDGHSDASAIFDSDNIRTALRQVATPAERQQRLDQWRRGGAIQCFNWIEPLMPAPFARVIWIPAANEDDTQKARRLAIAAGQIDGHAEAAPRKSGLFRQRYDVSSLEGLRNNPALAGPLVVTIDLDYFSGRPATEQTAEFEQVWDFVTQQRSLRAVTFAISRPYLLNDEEADHLLDLALHGALSLPTARIQFEPFLNVENDQSVRARELRARGESLPAYNITGASEPVRATILAQKERFKVEHDHGRWETLLQQWTEEAPRLHLEVKDAQPSADGVWRLPVTQAAIIQLLIEPWMSKAEHIEWFGLVPKERFCNVTDLGASQAGFVVGASSRPIWAEQRIDCSDVALPIGHLEHLFDQQTHNGSVRLFARALVDQKIRETPVIEIRRYTGTGFRAAVTEQFGLPYLFGSGQLSEQSDTGPEMNLGADCANFLVYALRRNGLRVPWSDPKQLRAHLSLVHSAIGPGTAPIIEGDLERGLIVHLGSHVAAVMEDRAPTGVLDANDLLAHQLKGTPEFLTLGELLRQRNRTTFDLLQVPNTAAAPTILFGGDIMLGRSLAAKISSGVDPFASIRDLLQSATLAAANLECTIGAPVGIGTRGRYSFRAPPEAASLLRSAGFRAVGLANNHALDFGEEALRNCTRILATKKIESAGVADATGDPYAAKLFELPGHRKLAIMAVSDVPVSQGDPSHGSAALVADTADRTRLSATLAIARAQADTVACMVHWGTENTLLVTDRQRELARWLVDHGVDLVIGSHPHCVQSLDFYHGRPIAYSLGNLVFDGAPGVPSWNHGALLQIKLSSEARVQSAELIPVILENGLPRLLQATPGIIAQQ